MNRCSLIVFSVLIMAANAAAETSASADLDRLRGNLLRLLDHASARGVLTATQVTAVREAGQLAAPADATPAPATLPAPVVAETATPPAEDVPAEQIRVTYVPEIVQRRIRDQVRAELRDEVTEDVVARAREERWGVPAGLPDWITALRIAGDARVSGVSDRYAADNVANSAPNFNAINRAGGITQAGADAFRNTTETTYRFLARVRLGLAFAIAERFEFGLRIGTQNDFSPVSLNQSLGAYGRGYELAIDRAFIRWRIGRDDDPALTFTAGRMPNPYTQNDLVWDEDLNFEGLATTWRLGFGEVHLPRGATVPRQQVYLTGGGFTLDESEIPIPDGSANDKWLYGGQLGYILRVTEATSLNFAIAYHHFANVAGRRNTFASSLLDWTAPAYLQKGNTLFDIRNDNDPNTELFALAADFTLLDAVARLRYEGFAPVVVTLTGGYVENIGFDTAEILARTGASIAPRNTGYGVWLDIGHPTADAAGAWAVFGGYRYLQRDAVLDAFTDSDFHRGGTDTKGWLLGARIALAQNVSLAARWWSTDAIDGPPLGIDTVQVDLNVQY